MWKLTELQKAAAVARYLAGEGSESIGRSYGVSGVAIRGVLRRRGVSIRSQVGKFRTFLGSTHAITRFPRQAGSFNGRPVCRFSVRSSRLVERLEKLGMVGGAVSPPLADSHHFWRGVVDGDGYIGISGGHAQFKLVGAAWLLESFRAFLVAEGVSSRISVRPHKANTAQNIEALAAGWAVDSTRSHPPVVGPARSRIREPLGSLA